MGHIGTPVTCRSLAVDFPGHGLSSHFPPGQPYYQIDYMAFARRIVKHYGWEDVCLMGHSLGCIVAFMYSCTYPNEVSSWISVEALEPVVVSSEDISDAQKGSFCSVIKASGAVLLERGMTKFEGDKYRFNRDICIKYSSISSWPLNTILQFAACIRCNLCYVRADAGLKYNSEENHLEIADVLQKSAKYFEYHTVESTHHVHLNNPDRVASLITNFLQKCV
ncbi:hypothetical protein PR048_000096 [Dryococelus australis]|uniref:AB hydrolase-1 domain-containing protein n=1 Tax=Dryococelus australis TaxID=614101 RepID=A0ABQ9IEV5_9NEOP|nr:hypothetical protein PR048_000096 [Dryococelus australis]